MEHHPDQDSQRSYTPRQEYVFFYYYYWTVIRWSSGNEEEWSPSWIVPVTTLQSTSWRSVYSESATLRQSRLVRLAFLSFL